VLLEQLVLLVLLVLMEPLVQQDQLVLLVLTERLDRQVLQDLLEPMALLGQLDQQVLLVLVLQLHILILQLLVRLHSQVLILIP
jgi:hypothetical protein